MGSVNGALKADADRVQADGRRVVDDLGRAADHVRDLFPEFARQVRELFDDGLERVRGQANVAVRAVERWPELVDGRLSCGTVA